ncbi:AMP-binding protein [Micromonospora sp. WMMD1120]|uniref:AMP-binding protein n=1 Tax=Micromonospora sp. WMMD1120 TaxID=3016106 RepID=UPI002415C61C|nr:AMP-binding protein [Micromonospora sp. WMMD1120]MDG4809544.1 AMP-binding protein [Micromonospora sp. WMMD1120]
MRTGSGDPRPTSAGTDPQPASAGTDPLARLLATVRPPVEPARTFRERGWWQTRSVVHDLYRASAAHPNRTAILAHRVRDHAGTPTVRVSYAQLTGYVERFAHALVALGVGPGDPVAFSLPNRWEGSALFFACLRIGAVAVPVLPSYGARDLAAVLEAAQPRVCVVPDNWAGVPQAEVLADLAASLPWLRRRVVVGDAAATGALDFADYFMRTPHERHDRGAWLRVPTDLADRVCLIVTTVGLDNAHRMFLHTPNSLRAGVRSPDVPHRDVTYSAVPIATLPSLLHAVVGPALRGGTSVLQDVWDPEVALDLWAQGAVGQVYALAVQWSELVSAQLERPRELGALRRALAADPSGTSTRLTRQVAEVLRVPLRAEWSSPQVGAATTGSGLETVLTAVDGPEGLFRVRVRGPSTCLAVWQRDAGSVRLVRQQQDGWSDTGDLVRVDDTGQIEVVRRAAGEVGGLFLVPVAEIEDHLLVHPRVAEAAVVPTPDVEYGELSCAVVVPAGDPPDLVELRTYLRGRGVPPEHLPARLELLGALPRDELGEIRRAELRDQLARRRARKP